MLDVNSSPSGSLSDRPLTLTAKAIAMVKEIVTRDGLVGQALRVSVNDGGCSGMSYALDFAAAPHDGDLTFEQEGVTLYVASDALTYLEGTTIDYVTGLHRAGFRFMNPQANRTCGCGESFSV